MKRLTQRTTTYLSRNLCHYYVPLPMVVLDISGGWRPVIETLEGNMVVSDGDYIVKGVQGECYPCKPDIFHETYDKVKIEEEEQC